MTARRRKRGGRDVCVRGRIGQIIWDRKRKIKEVLNVKKNTIFVRAKQQGVKNYLP